MSLLPPADLLQQLRWRYAVKAFDPARVIEGDVWDALEEALVLTPSSYGLQPWQFVVIQDRALKVALRQASWQQAQVEDCSHYVVLAARTGFGEADIQRFIERTAAVRGVPEASLERFRVGMVRDLVQGPRAAEVDAWAARQVYLALGNLLTAAAVLGVDTCPMEGLDPDRYDALLDLPAQGYRTVVACACGYRSPADPYAALAKVRYPLGQVVSRR